MSPADTHNPGGYKPGDPRYGLSGAALREYYRSKPPQQFIKCLNKPDSLAVRAAALDEHIADNRAHADRIRFSGPLLADDGETPVGTIWVIDLPDRAAAEAFLADEPYNRAGLFESVEITRFATSMEFRQVDRAPDPAMQMFVCECIDGPDGSEIRKTTGPAHHEYQARVMDRFVCRGPLRTDDAAGLVGSLFIIEVPDRAAAEAFVAAEPMTGAGVFSDVRITRWRYGKSISG